MRLAVGRVGTSKSVDRLQILGFFEGSICIFGNGYVCKGRIAILSFTLADDRTDYGEPRFITAGWLNARFVVLVWTPRQDGRRIISMRYGHADEEAYYRQQLG